jgi:hypothetical protein
LGKASDTGKANGQGNGLGLGSIPPGLSKLFGLDGTGDDTDDGEIAGLPPGLSNTPPGQLKKYVDYTDSFEQSPDDYYQMAHEQSIQGDWEATYDGTNKGKGDGKGKFGGFPGKTGSFGPAPGSVIADEKSGGKKPFCSGKALGGKPIILLTGDTVTIATGGTYVEPGYRACAPGINEITSSVVVSNGTGTLIVDNPSDGAYVINYDVTNPSPPGSSANTVTRTVLVGPNTAPTGSSPISDQSVSGNGVPDFVIDLATVFTDTEEASSALTYTITGNTFNGNFQSIGITSTTLTINYQNGPTGDGTGDIIITATDSWGATATDTFTVTDS